MTNLKRAISGICILTFAAYILSGCNSSKDATKSTKTDTIIFAQGAHPKKLDPAFASDGESSKVICNIFEPLVKFPKESTDTVEPCLAESWEEAPDGLSYVFHLKKGVKFHDGTEFNAEAVKINIDRMRDPAIEGKPYTENFSAVKDVEVIDAHTVKIIMSEVYTPFLKNLAMVLGGGIISPAVLKKTGNAMIPDATGAGTGPYKFVKQEKDQNVVLVRNEGYHGEKAKTQNLIFRIIPDTAARVAALKNGDVDAIDGIDPTVVEQIKSAGCTLHEKDALNVCFMSLATDQSPFNNVALRRAASQAINIDDLVKNIYKGYATVATCSYPPSMPGYDSSIQFPAYDPEAAKAAFAAAGIKEIRMLTFPEPRPYLPCGAKVLAEYIQGEFRKIGIEATITQKTWTTYLDELPKRNFDICFLGWGWDIMDQDNFAKLLADHKDLVNNSSNYNNPEYDSIIKKATTVPNGPERYAFYTQAEKIVADAVPIRPLAHCKLLSASRPNLKGLFMDFSGNMYFSEVTKTN